MPPFIIFIADLRPASLMKAFAEVHALFLLLGVSLSSSINLQNFPRDLSHSETTGHTSRRRENIILPPLSGVSSLPFSPSFPISLDAARTSAS